MPQVAATSVGKVMLKGIAVSGAGCLCTAACCRRLCHLGLLAPLHALTQCNALHATLQEELSLMRAILVEQEGSGTLLAGPGSQQG